MADVAINASTVSIKFGKYATTLSFSLTLIDLKKVINLCTFLFSSLHVLIFLVPFSLINVIALLLSFFERRFSAKFNLEFVKNLFLKKILDFSILFFFKPFTLENSQIEFQKSFGLLILHSSNFLKFLFGLNLYLDEINFSY